MLKMVNMNVLLVCFACLFARVRGADKATETRLAMLGRQLVMQQLFVEERIRSDGDSGIKQLRHYSEGTRPYHSSSHVGSAVSSIHDHSNNIRTIGMGEIIAVLNGVEFRTRHNDYGLRMPSTTSSRYHELEMVPFPDVPPPVLKKKTVAGQIAEMRLWFKAWKKQDHSVRDYRKYFKPVLCYLEGAWTKSPKLEESFFSDRHFLDASSWFDLQEKVRYTAYTGGKSKLENYSYLPTTIMNMINGTLPQIAQWNYRILCHPLKQNLPLNRFRVVDDLMSRMSSKTTLKEHEQTRAARFTLNPMDSAKWVDGKKNYGLLDRLMGEIPGTNNYRAKLYDTSFDRIAYPYGAGNKGKKLNVGFYHRWMTVAGKDAMGRKNRHRGFADQNLFVAMTTKGSIAGVELEWCASKKNCTILKQRWTYAIPLEIIYMTPLLQWNPHNVKYKGDQGKSLGRTVMANGRSGSTTDAKKAFDGINNRKFYQTPIEFFAGDVKGRSAADTVRKSVGVLDRRGKLRKMKASGTRVFLPNIPGVGTLRTRYPIVPVHGEGSAVWKELEALKDIVMEPKKYARMFREK